jgi:hypothetical protein
MRDRPWTPIILPMLSRPRPAKVFVIAERRNESDPADRAVIRRFRIARLPLASAASRTGYDALEHAAD